MKYIDTVESLHWFKFYKLLSLFMFVKKNKIMLCYTEHTCANNNENFPLPPHRSLQESLAELCPLGKTMNTFD